jgi:hypothetical protein
MCSKRTMTVDVKFHKPTPAFNPTEFLHRLRDTENSY